MGGIVYHFMKGKLATIEPTFLVVEVAGIGYQIFCANPYRWQSDLHQEIVLYLELVVREDAMILYGFKDEAEKNLFLQLNKVSGIGPKSALSILALEDQEGLIQAIEAADAKYLMKFPGVGKKTAQQMILDLQGKLDLSQMDKNPETQVQNSQLVQAIGQALEGLGYSKREIDRVLPQLEKQKLRSTQEGLSLAFKLLIK